MITHEQRVAAAFNQAASTYHHHSDIQALAGQRLIHELMTIRHRYENVIDAGCGTGLTTAALARSISYKSFTALDIASSLLKQTRVSTENIRCVHGDFNALDASRDKYDLIFSNLALHWSYDFAVTLRVLHAALNNHGLLAFSLPLIGTFAEMQDHFSIHPFMSKVMIENLCADAGLQIIQFNQHSFQKNFPDTVSALRDLKLTGTHYVRERRHRALRGRTFLSKILLQHLTYHFGFFIVNKQHG